jgi:AraC-like DNA-binding protein
MIYKIAKPSLELSPFVKHYWTMDKNNPIGQEYMQRIVPCGLLEIIFYFDNKPVSSDQDKSIDENTVITGQLNEYYDIKISGKISLFSVIFQPHGLSAFLDLPLKEMNNLNVPLKLIFKDDIDEIESRLFESGSFSERIKIIEEYFYKILGNKGITNNFERIQNSVFAINQRKGIIDIESLAVDTCFSRKQYERVFSNTIGTSPKQFLKVVRFQNAIYKKSKNKNLSLTDLSYQCGYYDQAHMINDFQKLSGMSPGHYFSDCEPYSDYFQ